MSARHPPLSGLKRAALRTAIAGITIVGVAVATKTVDGIEHVGLVVKDDHDGTIESVDGNTAKAVKIRIRPVSEVVGYGYPDYLR